MLEPLVWKFEIFDVGDLRGYQAGCVLRFSDFGCVWPGGFMNGMHQQQVNKLWAGKTIPCKSLDFLSKPLISQTSCKGIPKSWS